MNFMIRQLGCLVVDEYLNKFCLLFKVNANSDSFLKADILYLENNVFK